MNLSFPWLNDAALRRIMDAAQAAGGEARVVGGAVRDAVMGRAVGDIDIATTLPPDAMSATLARAGIKVVPTGLEHGTVTAVVDGKGYEVTSLRRDVTTDGRRATVAYTNNWQEDAARRDFTLNALYVDANGHLYDYFGGVADAEAGRVRFIGEAEARIREDVLRILRFFRFTAWFGQAADAEGLKACRALAGLLPNLSAERVAREILKLLAAPDPAPVWQLMVKTGVLAHWLPEAREGTRLAAVVAVETRYHQAPSALRRMAALLPCDTAVAESVAARLKLSRRETETLRTLAEITPTLKGKLDPVPFRRTLYAHGVVASLDAAMLLTAAEPCDLADAFATAAAWENPVFPLQGADLLKAGFTAGPEMGTALRAAEQWWMDGDFRPSKAECLAKIGKKPL